MEKHTTKITSKSIEQSGLPVDYKKAIAEFIWNGFDAKATQIDINFNSNETGYLFNFSIEDNGEGIELESINKTFGYFLDSQKTSTFTKDGFIKGKKGKGRFAFSLFANKAIWKTKYLTKESKILQYDIEINKTTQDKFGIENKVLTNKLKTGTIVNFYDLHSLTADLLENNDFEEFLCGEFGWFLFLNKESEYSIKINGKKINYLAIIDDYDEFETTIGNYVFSISFLRWSKKIGDKYFYYFLNDEKKEVYRKHTSFNNKAIDFHHSVYIESDFFNDFIITKDEHPVLGFSKKNQSAFEYKKIIQFLNKYVLDKEKLFIREQQADALIENYRSKKIFPLFKNNSYEKYREKDLENVVKELYCINPNIFQGLKDTQSKTLVGFLNLLLDSEQRENILEIIENIIQLTDEEREYLAKSLKKTTFSQINKLIKLLIDRFETVEIIKSLVFDHEIFATERDHIQKIIENNYWLFGEQYHIVSADKNFETLLNNYLYYIENKNKIPEKINDKQKLKRPDIFICRKSDVLDSNIDEYSIEENIIVELKRPSITIGKEHYSQIEDYLIFIRNQPRFNSQLRKWKFLLIGKEMDNYIKDKYKSQQVKGKKYLIESIDNYEIYALTWDDVFKIFDNRHKHLINKLEYRESIVEELESRGVLFDRNTADELLKKAVNQ